MPTELPKAYEPKDAQAKWLTFWDDKGYFHSDPDDTRKPYTIVIPPPNVTGALHTGHALNNTLQDVLIRWRRMQGYNALWMPGTDHAGIATQAVVERLILLQEKKTRHEIGREELVKRIWEWKDKYEARILGQLKQLGTSCDWRRTRFTLDDMCAKAVRETFFRMFKDGYIYRGKRLVNWDTQLQTSVADDETYTEDTKGGFWTFKYPITGEPGALATGGIEYIRFSTTRPETMLGDTAICVHPSDERYQHLIGKTVTLPLSQREIPIIADGLLADPTLGTGCVKVTPAHDPNDYACWQRNPQIGMINILNPDGTVNENGGIYKGLDRYKAREAVVQAMDDLGLFEGKEDRIIPLKYSDRSKSPIEPLLSDQWFVKMSDFDSTGEPPASAGGGKGLAQLAIDAVSDGRVKFFPERYARTYLEWLGEKRDWCVSRQLWWGHRIPVWSLNTSCVGGKLEAREDLINSSIINNAIHYGSASYQETENHYHVCIINDDADVIKELNGLGYVQSEDVLDTWFSSALWPHSTLGWPEDTAELKYYYPTSTLCTSRDIITLWVARMVMTGLYNVGDIPFHHVYVHPALQDGFGERMSKSKGNGLDPLDIIDLYGTDALRFGMVNLATETQDSRLPVVNVCPHCGTQVPVKQEHMYMRTKKLACPSCKQSFRPGGPWPSEDPDMPTARQASDRFELGRNFANKLWNATRFILMNLEGYTPAEIDIAKLAVEDRWIISRLATTTNAVTAALEAYKFADVARLIYDFAWTEFCDWYIEMSKSRRSDPACQRVLLGVLDGIIRLIHPVMPFIAESLWHALNEVAPVRGLPTPVTCSESVVIAPWPSYPPGLLDTTTEAAIARMQEIIRGVREVRNRYQIDKEPLALSMKCSAAVANEIQPLAAFLTSLGGLKSFDCGPTVVKPPQSAGHVTPEFEAYISLAGLIDPAVEGKRLEKQIAEKTKQREGIAGKLANEGFVSRAPAEVVAQQRAQVLELDQQIAALTENLAELA